MVSISENRHVQLPGKESYSDSDSEHSQSGRVLNKSGKARAPVRKWTKKEDETLRRGVLAYLAKNEPPKYTDIVKELPHRSAKQAKERWKNSLNPDITKGLWSNEEMLQLLDLIIEKGENWTEIQRVLSHRSMHCIKSKGRKMLGEAISKKLKRSCKGTINKDWTNDERKKLLELHREHGYDMETICFGLKTGKSMAQANRELIKNCKCDSCSSKLKELKSTKLEFKLAWAVAKAKELKVEIIKSMVEQKSSRQGKSKSKSKANSVCGKRKVRSKSQTNKSSVKTQKPKLIKQHHQVDFSQTDGEYDMQPLLDSFGNEVHPLDTDLLYGAAESAYATVMRDVDRLAKTESEHLNFSRYEDSEFAFQYPMKKTRALPNIDSLGLPPSEVLENEFLNSFTSDNIDDLLVSLDVTPQQAINQKKEKGNMSKRRRTSFIRAWECINNQSITVN